MDIDTCTHNIGVDISKTVMLVDTSWASYFLKCLQQCCVCKCQ